MKRLLNYRFLRIPVLFLVTLLCITGCKKDEPTPEPVPVQDGGAYILNEGNFQWGNGSVDYLRFADKVYTTDLFKSVNNRALGDVVQSMRIINGKGYIVVNNSGKIEVVNMADFSSAGTITGLISPRYILPVSSSEAYVSDLYSNALTLVDLNTLSITGSIKLNGSAEEMIAVGETVFVTNTRTAYLYLVNTVNHQLTDSIAIGFGGNSIVSDAQGHLWVMCMGDQALGQPAGLYCIDPASHAVEKTFSLGSYLQIWDKVRINAAGNTLYFLNSGVWTLDIAATQLPASPLISSNGRQFHGVSIAPADGTLYISDAVDYVQHGKIFRYSPAGVLLDSLSAGIIPTEVVFF